MKQLSEQIIEFSNDFHQSLTQAINAQMLEQVRTSFLGRNGKLNILLATMKNLTSDEKRIYGPQLNNLKLAVELAFNEKKEQLANNKLQQLQQKKIDFDVTAYNKLPFQGGLHIYTHIIEEIENIFMSMGYQVVDGPEVETGYYNFEALNIPENHPARDMQDTFWLTLPDKLMRTHTSNVQIRFMEQHKPPFAIIAPGRVYRNEATDASHDFMFTQLECLVVGETINLGNLLATAQHFLQRLLNKNDLTIRARPGYFPFVEPGIEIDASCPFCVHGCSICKKTRWIELLGSGLVHPNVLKYCGIDSKHYAGFAFGMGIERVAMLRYGITDIRLFHSGNLNFLQQFS